MVVAAWIPRSQRPEGRATPVAGTHALKHSAEAVATGVSPG